MRQRPKATRAAAVLSVILSALGLLAYGGVQVAEGGGEWEADPIGSVLMLLAFLLFPLVGATIVWRQPRHLVGWILCAIGFLVAVGTAAQAYSEHVLPDVGRPGPIDYLSAWIANWWWYPLLGLVMLYTLMFFPTGTLLSRRWRPLLWLSSLGVGGVTFIGMVEPRLSATTPTPGPGPGRVLYELDNPIGLPWLGDPENGPVGGVLFFLFLLCLLGAVISMIIRFKRSRGVERQQLKWFTFATLLIPVSIVLEDLLGIKLLNESQIPFAIVLGGLPTAIGIAILKHRLYDIDIVINKTLVFGGLAAFITAVYVAIVVGVGTLIGQGDEPNLGLSIAATAVVAVAFQPVRERVQHFANRLVYGKRATPYEVLSEFSDRVAETYATEDVLPRMAKTVAEGTGAAHAEVWLRSGQELRRAAAWPEDEGARESLAMSNGSVPDVPGVDRMIEVRHQGELLGALTVTKPAGEPLAPAEDKLLSDLAGQAGLLLRNVGLTSELLARLEELKASRQRLVAAQDEERRRLERNLHDGAQQHLVALKMKLSLAARLAKDEDEKLRNTIAQLSADADEALETLRDLARGIYPPLLADQGLKAALESQARKAPVRVTVDADGLARYPQEVEAAIYFCVLEALQNVAKYAKAGRAWVSVQEREGELVFEVRDDGAGFDPATAPKGAGTTNMSDRLESLSGSLELRSRPGEGTSVAGRLPLRIKEPA